MYVQTSEGLGQILTPIRIVSLNIGATNQGSDTSRAVPLPPLENLVGLSSFLKGVAGDTDNMVVGLQAVGNCLNTSEGINQAWYLADKMGSGWVHRFQRILTAKDDGRPKKYDGHCVPASFKPYINDCDNAGFGNAVISNVSITKTQYWTFAWDADNTKEYGERQRGAIAVKLKINNHYLWFVNSYLSNCIIAAERQIWQLLGNIGAFDPSTPVIVVGDFNIRKDGYHKRNGISEDHKKVYERMIKMFEAAGFVQVGENDGFTFKSWEDYSKIDYIFLLDTNKAGQTSIKIINVKFQLLKPADFTDSNLIYTDHKALIMDLECSGIRPSF